MGGWEVVVPRTKQATRQLYFIVQKGIKNLMSLFTLSGPRIHSNDSIIYLLYWIYNPYAYQSLSTNGWVSSKGLKLKGPQAFSPLKPYRLQSRVYQRAWFLKTSRHVTQGKLHMMHKLCSQLPTLPLYRWSWPRKAMSTPNLLPLHLTYWLLWGFQPISCLVSLSRGQN